MADTPVSMTLSAEVAEAVRLRDAAATWAPKPGHCRGGFKIEHYKRCKECGAYEDQECGRPEKHPRIALSESAPQLVDLIERLFNALKATQDAYVETSAALTLEQDRNEGLHARVRELEALIRTIDDALSE